MIKPPVSPEFQGAGKIATKLRELERMIKMLVPTGAGVSYGPLGTTVKPPPKGSSQASGEAVWL